MIIIITIRGKRIRITTILLPLLLLLIILNGIKWAKLGQHAPFKPFNAKFYNFKQSNLQP